MIKRLETTNCSHNCFKRWTKSENTEPEKKLTSDTVCSTRCGSNLKSVKQMERIHFLLLWFHF